MSQSAALNAGYGVGFILSLLLVYGAVLAVGIYFSRRLTRKRRDGRTVRWPIGLAVGLILLMLLGQCASTARASSFSSGVQGAHLPV